MANVLNTDRQIAIVAALTEVSSIRSVERMTSVHRDTVPPVVSPLTAVRAALIQEYRDAQTA